MRASRGESTRTRVRYALLTRTGVLLQAVMPNHGEAKTQRASAGCGWVYLSEQERAGHRAALIICKAGDGSRTAMLSSGGRSSKSLSRLMMHSAPPATAAATT